MKKIKKLLSILLKHKWLIPFEILGIIIFLVIAYIVYWSIDYAIKEGIVDKKFHKEVLQVPQVNVTFFNLWEGDARVNAEIKDKGFVAFWYGTDGVPRIVRIKKFLTEFECFNVDGEGNKIGYGHTRNLELVKNSKFKQWFPFEVNNLKDLVNKYDEIVQILDTFPKNPEMVPV